MFDKFLQSRMSACRSLCDKLGSRFSYVGILGSHVTSCAFRANRKTSSAGELPESDCGFVVKVNDGGIFYEYSLDDITGDTDSLAEKIEKEIKRRKDRKRTARKALRARYRHRKVYRRATACVLLGHKRQNSRPRRAHSQRRLYAAHVRSEQTFRRIEQNAYAALRLD